MSGGHYDYKYYALNELADWIEKDFLNEGKTAEGYDRLNDADFYQRQRIIQEATSLMEELRINAQRARELEWYLSGDTGADTYLKRLQKIQDAV